MQRFHAVDDFQYTVDQFLSLAVAQAAQRNSSAQVPILVGVATWAAQWTLAGNLDGKGRGLSLQNHLPGLQNLRCLHARPLLSLITYRYVSTRSVTRLWG